MIGCIHLKDIAGIDLGSQTGGSLEPLGLLRHIYVSLHKMVIYHGNLGYEALQADSLPTELSGKSSAGTYGYFT